jgi:hypothetical protein
MKDEIILYR